MKKSFAAMLSVLAAFSAAAAPAADLAEPTSKARPKNVQKAPRTSSAKPPELFAGTKKYLAEKAAKTAEIVKSNMSKLNKTMNPEPQPSPAVKKRTDAAAKAKDAAGSAATRSDKDRQ